MCKQSGTDNILQNTCSIDLTTLRDKCVFVPRRYGFIWERFYKNDKFNEITDISDENR
jgi:hypothetical protein